MRQERHAVIAIRRLMIRGWGVEAGMRVRVIRPEPRGQAPRPSITKLERAMHEATIRRMADRNRSEAEVRWFMIGGV
jgi:hypothetical protein